MNKHAIMAGINTPIGVAPVVDTFSGSGAIHSPPPNPPLSGLNEKLLPITAERIAALLQIREAVPGVSADPQCQRLLMAMMQCQHVSTFEASRYLDVYYPPARKLELVRQGHPVQTVMRPVLTEAGKVHRVGFYYLARG